MPLKEILQSKVINEWKLLWLVTIPMSVAMVTTVFRADLSSAEGVSSMIAYSVRWSVPWLYLAFAASSIHALFPGLLSRWLLRNRKIIGLCFAAGMSWQILFIVWLVVLHSDYYVEEVYVLRDVIEGLLGYCFLFSMVLTSFKFGRSRLTPRQWKLLHKTGIYFLWAYAFSVYWYELFYYDQPDWVDYAYYWTGILAWSLRIAAWSRKQLQLRRKEANTTFRPALNILGIGVVTLGALGVIFGSMWTELAHQHLYGFQFATFLELYAPYWPFIPFLPLFIIVPGALLIVKSRS